MGVETGSAGLRPPPYSTCKPTRFPGRQKPSQFRSVSEACRGLRTEFRPFSRILRLKSPASLCPQNSVSRTKPDVRITRIRLSDKTSRLRPRHVVPKPAQTYEPEACRDAGRAGSLHPRLPCASAVGSVQTLRWVGARSPGRPFLSERSLRPPVFHTPTFVEGVPPSVAAMGLPAVRRRRNGRPLCANSGRSQTVWNGANRRGPVCRECRPGHTS